MRELEVKLRFDQIEVMTLLDKLQHHGHKAMGPVTQVDYVYASRQLDIKHPQEGTVVARVRIEDSGASLTVKVRRSADLDRTEYETGVTTAEAARAILSTLGLEHLVTISKKRWSVELDDDVHLCVDEVEGLGVFVEIEIMTDDNTEVGDQLLAATLANLTGLLGNSGHKVDRGYDRLTLEQDS